MKNPVEDFYLIESLRFEPNVGLLRITEHLERLRRSCELLGFPYDLNSIETNLKKHRAAQLEGQSGRVVSASKVRLALYRDGRIEVTSERLKDEVAGAVRTVVVSPQPLDIRTGLWSHKTSRRQVYDEAFGKWAAPFGHYDVLFQNLHGDITEGSRNNLFIVNRGLWFTPPIECGLLPGVFRQKILKEFSEKVQETRISIKDLKEAEQVFLCNSVRGLVEVKCIQPCELVSAQL